MLSANLDQAIGQSQVGAQIFGQGLYGLPEQGRRLFRPSAARQQGPQVAVGMRIGGPAFQDFTKR